jgi:hypothetical protein
MATSELYRTATGVVGGPDGQVLLIDPGGRPRLRAWPRMAGLHDRNARGLFASLRRAGPA